MQPAQYDRLKQLIEASVILTPTEKSEWLDMLIIMNDKQSSELELILKAETPQPVPVAPHNLPMSDVPHTPAGQIPNLSHISNLPSGLVSGGNIGRVSQPAKVVSPPFSQPSQSALPPQPSHQDLPAPKLPPIQPRPTSPVQQRVSIPPMFAGSVQKPVSAPRSAPVSAPPVSKPTKGIPIQLDSITDAGRLTISSMRSFNPSDLLLRLQQLSKHEGYFSLLSYLEDSQLYKAYIATGKKMLSGMPQSEQGNPDPTMLTKAEFETFADILRKIQIN